MPSKYRRVGVVRDPELDRVLKQADRVLGSKPAAAQLRELALRGSRGLVRDDVPSKLREAIEKHGGRYGKGNPLETMERLGLPAKHDGDPYALTKALEEQRKEFDEE